MIKKELILLKNIPNSRLEGSNHTLFQTKMVEFETLFQTRTAEKKTFGAAHAYTAYIRDYPPPPGGEKRVADYESRCLRKRD